MKKVEPLLSVEGLRTAYTVHRRNINVLDGVDLKIEYHAFKDAVLAELG